MITKLTESEAARPRADEHHRHGHGVGGAAAEARGAEPELHAGHRCGHSQLLRRTRHFSELKLDRTDLTDKSLAWLTAQKNLKYLDLYHTLMTEQGFKSLKKAQPNTEINWSLDAARTRRRT